MSTIKQRLYNHCVRYVNDRIDSIQNEIRLQQVAANAETKSSVGDKYETGRAMAQLEIERNSTQLREAEKLRVVLQRLDLTKSTDVVVVGSLVQTSRGVVFVAISLGITTVDHEKFLVISSDSPIGKLLMGKRVGEEAVFMGERYVVEGIE